MRQGKNWIRHRRIKISLAVWMLGIGLSGCVRLTPVWVLKGDEVIPLSKGENFTAPYDGCFYSLQAEKRVLDAKRIETKLR